MNKIRDHEKERLATEIERQEYAQSAARVEPERSRSKLKTQTHASFNEETGEEDIITIVG